MAMLAATEGVVTTMPQALVNTALGMGTVFLVLILISFIIYLLKFVPALLETLFSGKKQEETVSVSRPAPAPKAAPAAGSAPAPSAGKAPAVKSSTDDTQLAAVIMAAIMAAMEQEGSAVPVDGLVIRSIKKRY